MIDYDKKDELLIMYCDKCNDDPHHHNYTWAFGKSEDCINELRAEGWDIQGTSKSCIITCPKCQRLNALTEFLGRTVIEDDSRRLYGDRYYITGW